MAQAGILHIISIPKGKLFQDEQMVEHNPRKMELILLDF